MRSTPKWRKKTKRALQNDTIADLLGHARTVTDIYIKVDTRLADEALVRVVNAALPR